MLNLDDVLCARETIRPHLAPTALRRSFALRPRNVWLKLECWQPTGSFKVRGATNVMASLTEAERLRGVVAASAGNHALGVAFAAGALGGDVATTLFVPETAPRAKVEQLRTYPVSVHERGATYDDAHDAAEEHRVRTGAVYVHAYEDTRTAAGQGTTGLEILEALPDLGTVVVPVGGGGLIAGIATVVKARRPEAAIVAVQPAASPALRESIRQDRPLLHFEPGPTLADGLAGGIGQMAWDHRGLIDAIVEVDERETEEAMVDLLLDDHVVAEASGAVGVAAARSGRLAAFEDRGPIAVVVTGGNVDRAVLARLVRAHAR
jgi:threonine dehydratase